MATNVKQGLNLSIYRSFYQCIYLLQALSTQCQLFSHKIKAVLHSHTQVKHVLLLILRLFNILIICFNDC